MNLIEDRPASCPPLLRHAMFCFSKPWGAVENVNVLPQAAFCVCDPLPDGASSVGIRGCGPAIHVVTGEGRGPVRHSQAWLLWWPGAAGPESYLQAFQNHMISTGPHNLPPFLTEDSMMVPHPEIPLPSFKFPNHSGSCALTSYPRLQST